MKLPSIWRNQFRNTGLARTTDDEDNLAVLQEIYASTNGFQDAAGNSITPNTSPVTSIQ